MTKPPIPTENYLGTSTRVSYMYAPPKLLASSGPRAEGVPTNNQRDQGS